MTKIFLLFNTLRYPFSLEGDTLIAGVVASDVTRTSAADIEAHLEALFLLLWTA
tara:strand:+ start:334 stop:495 length:162 start_codon:yes stop_codon:yes gene_type:complete